MIESITLKNFKGHKQLHIDFPPGLTIITGPNYSGKSTVLYAILFAFWGVSAVPGGAKRVPLRGHPPGASEVHLKFFHAGDTYKIERKIAAASLYRGNALVATGLSGVSKELESIIGIPPKFFQHLKYVEQGSTQALLTLGVAELHRIIEHVSGANLVNHVISRSGAIASEATAALAALGDPPDLEQLSVEVEQAYAKVSQMEAEVSGLLAKAKSLEEEVLGKRKELSGIVESNLKFERMSAQLQSVEEQLASAEDSMLHDELRMRSNQESAKLADTAYEIAKELKERYSKCSAATATFEACEDTYREVVVALNGSKKTLNSCPPPDPGDSVNLTPELEKQATLTAELRQLKKQWEEYGQAIESSVCQTCKRPFEGKNLAVVQAQRDAVADAYNAKEVVLNKLTANLVKLREQSAAYALAKQRHDQARQLHDQAVRKEEGARAALGTAKAALAQTDASLTKLEVDEAMEAAHRARTALGAYSEAKDSVERARARVSELKSKADELREAMPKTQITDTSPLKQKLSIKEQRLAELISSLHSLKSQCQSGHEDVRVLETALESATKLSNRIDEYQRDKATSTKLSKYLRSNRDRFMQELWGQISSYASDFARGCTGGAIEAVSRSTDGTFMFTEGGYTDAVVAASGAQRSLMALGVQLALDALLPDTLGALLLDEPTADMDSAHSAALTHTLANAGRQIVMVSHREMDASLAQAHIDLS